VSPALTRWEIVHTINPVKLSYDAAKNDRNIRERGLSFDHVGEFEFTTAKFSVDSRRDYGETRRRALGFLDGRLHALVFVETDEGIRVVSFRKANKREVKDYEQATRS
jgi:uncharacterized DUF497 family protein